MTEKPLTGKIAREAIGVLDIPRYPAATIAAYRALGDATGAISDAMDELGLQGVIAASTLKPTMPDAMIVGPAVTLRNIMQPTQPGVGARDRVSKMAEIEGHNLSGPGDVLVIEGANDISNMGGISATIGKRQGQIGAIVDGGVRDVAEQRRIGYPVWSRSITALTGKWRLHTVAVNVPVQIAGVQVKPGDLIVADPSAVCVIPREHVDAVLVRAQQITEGEKNRYADIEAGVSVPDLAKRTHVFKFKDSAS